ncbi:hypothetical protein KR200_002580, partial [Drosophila serrata]
IEARCLPRTGNMWQQQDLFDDATTSCNAPPLLHSFATSSATLGAAPKIVYTEIERETPAVTLTSYVYQWVSRPASMANTCSQQAPKVDPESKPESSYPEWECEQELKQHELSKPEVPKRHTATLTASEM